MLQLFHMETADQKWSYVSRTHAQYAHAWRGWGWGWRLGRKEQVDVVSAVLISSCLVIKHAAAHTSNFLLGNLCLIIRQKVLSN